MSYLLNRTGWYLFSSMVLISCHKPAAKPDNNVPALIPFTGGNILQITMHQPSQTKDTAFFENGLIAEIKGENVSAKFKLGGNWLQQKDEYSKTNILFRRTCYGEFYGKMSWESINDYPNLTSGTNGSKEYGWNLDSLTQILYFNTDRSTRNYTWKIDFSYDADGNIKCARQYDTTTTLICTYNFTYNRDSASPFRAIFAYNFDFYFVDTSPLNDAIKAALLFSNNRLTKVTAASPGFTPLNFDYIDNKRLCRSILINNQPAYSFTYASD
jgi:hypothetical protein